MADLTLGQADECIYCGCSETTRTKEHVIAASFAGNMIIETASCSKCADITSRLEAGISRRTYHVARSFYSLPTRRPKKYPTDVTVTLWFGKYGPKQDVKVPIKHAPIEVIIPEFVPNPEKSSPHELWSNNQLRGVRLDEGNFDLKTRAILQRYRAFKLSFSALPFKVNADFERVMWKIACGFFWLTDKKSLRLSDAQSFVLGRQPPIESIDNVLLSRDIYSRPHQKSPRPIASAAVFSRAEERHKFLHCEINFFGKLGLPLYYCRIPNSRQTEFPRVEFNAT